MASKFWLRHQVGMMKWRLTQLWPALLRHDRAVRLRPGLATEARRLPAIPLGPPLDLEVHMLCGEATADMGLWASWSLLRFLPGALLYVHSDGTLLPETLAAWRAIVPQLRIVASDEADARVERELAARYPRLVEYRRRIVNNRQCVDYCLFGERRLVLGMDSDVLCFRPPHAILEALRAGAVAPLWMRDDADCYSMPREAFVQRYGEHHARINGGFWLTPRFGAAEFAGMEADLTTWEAPWVDAYWSGQTLIAAAFARMGGEPFDPTTYYLGLGGHRRSYVVRHYPGPKLYRPRFFTEGIPAVRAGGTFSATAVPSRGDHAAPAPSA